MTYFADGCSPENKLERVFQTNPVIAAQHAIQICLAEIANFMVEAVEIELVGNPPQDDFRTNQQQSGYQSGQQCNFESK